MKRLLFLMVCLLACAQMGVWADKIPVAQLKTNGGGNKTLTFTMVDEGTTTVTSGDGAYAMNTGSDYPGWYSSRSKIDSVAFEPSFADVRPTSLAYWFYGADNLVSIVGIEYLNTSEVTTSTRMFYNCSKLTSFDMSHFNLAKDKDMSYMFYSCRALTELKLGDNLNTDSVSDMQRLCYGCSKLASFDFSKLHTQSVANFQYMFYSCSALTTADISTFDFSSVDTVNIYRTGYCYLFAMCSRLTSVNVGNNMFPGATSNARPFYSVGSRSNPVELKIGSKFDKSVLGTISGGAYSWQGGYFSEPIVVEDPVVYPKPATPEYVDLGLSVKWATFNLGATAPEEGGYYYAWGETEPKASYSWSTYKFGPDSAITKYNKTDSMTTLTADDDAAAVALGGNWRMPTVDEINELHDNCTWTSTTQNGVRGILVTAPNGNSIFLPAAGAKGYNTSYPDSVVARSSTNFYWTSSKYLSEDDKAVAKYFWGDTNFFNMTYNRSFGLSIRPVYVDDTKPQPTTKKPMAILAANAGGNKTLTFTMVDDTTKAVTSGDGAYSLNISTNSPKWSASSVDTVVFDKSFADARPTSMYSWFNYASKLKVIKGIENLNTSEVTTTQNAFRGCSSLDSLDMSHFNLAKTTNMSYMFYSCSALKSVKFGDLHTDSVKDMQRLFYGCQSLASVDFSKLNTTSLANVQYMFYNCSSLQTIDISTFDLAKVDTTDQSWRTGYAYMFANCSNVTSVNVGNNMFKGTTKNDRPFYRVGTADSPVELKIGPKFDKTVLGSNASGYYNWEGGYFNEPTVVSTAKYVDLGLSVKWGDMNLGAAAPEETGNYYAWGETAPKDSYSWDNYKFGATDSTITKYNKVDSLTTLQPADDAATVALGGKWRMPTATEFAELKDNCTWTQTTENGVGGVKITAANGNSIFLPFTGHYQTDNPSTLVGGAADYWTSSKYIGSNSTAVAKERFRGNNNLWNFSWDRAYGLAIRPVYDESSTVTPDTTDTKKDSVYVAVLGTKADGKTRTLRFTRVAEITEKGAGGKDGMYTLPTGSGNPGWYSANYNIDTVTIDPSFAGARPITTRRWFYNMMNLKKIVGIEYLNTSESTDMYYMFYGCNKLDSLDLSHFNTAKVTNMTDMFYNCSSLTYLDVSNFNTENVTNMTYMFYNCSKLKSLNVKSFNTAKVTGMRSMFYNCSSVDSLDLSSFNVENVTNMSQMFYGCSSLKSLDVSSFKPVNVTDIRGMFSGLANVETLKLGEFSTPKVTNMSQLFYRCEKVKELNVSKFNTESATDMGMMFDQCKALTSLDLSSFNTSKVTDFDLMFYHCDNLQSLNLKSFDTSNATTIRLMFSNCSSLKELDLSHFNTSKVTSMDQMFYNCSSLTKLEVGNFDTHLATSFFQVFGNCSSLKTVDVSKWNTANVEGFTHMFVGCTSLQKVDVSKFNTAKSSSFRFMFSNCSNLEELDVDSFDTGNATNFYGMFNGCSKLTKLDVSHFNTEKATTMYGMFYGCANVKELDLSSFRTPYLRDMGIMFTGCRSLTKLDISTFTTDSIIVDTEGSRPTGYYGAFNNCTGLTELNVGDNSFKGAKSTDVVMYGVGTQQNPCLLIVGDKFDTTVLGQRLLGVYNWLNGYFNLAFATGIKSVAEDGQGTTGFDPDAPAYDLTGRRVNASYHGVVIQNGKKYVRK